MIADVRIQVAAHTREHLNIITAALVGTCDVASLRPHSQRVFELVPPSIAALFRILPAAGTRRVTLDVHPHELTLGVDAQGTPPISLRALVQLCDELSIPRATLTYTCPLFNAAGKWHRQPPSPFFCIESSLLDESMPSPPLPSHYLTL